MSRLTLILIGGPHILLFGIWRPLNVWRMRARTDGPGPLPDRTAYMRMMVLQIGAVGLLSIAIPGHLALTAGLASWSVGVWDRRTSRSGACATIS